MRAILVLLLLGGCNDPYHWQGHWDAAQVNEANLAAQAADWRDLARGHGDPGSDGQEAAAAVDRLRHGAVKPLPDTVVSDIPVQNAAPAAPLPAGPAVGAPN